MKTSLVGLLLVSAILLGGCSQERGSTGDGEGSGEKAAPPAPSPGELVFSQNCKVCHAQGINGAPIVGNKTMWGPRVEQGLPVLIEHAMNGYGLMPAKGGKENLTEQQITDAIAYMVSRVGK